MLIAIEGIDGCGKGTQASRLVQQMNTNFNAPNHVDIRAHLCTFPQYSTFFGERIREYLSGEYGLLASMPPLPLAALYALNRHENRELLERTLAAGITVVCDRYVASNLGHQASKVSGLDKQLELVRQIEHMEYQTLGLPRPTLTIYLDIAVEVSGQRVQERRATMARRQGKTITRDIHEDDLDYLARVRDLYLHLAHAREDWVLIDGMDGKRQRPKDSIGIDVMRAVRERQV